MKVKRRAVVETDFEQRIITGLIVSDNYCKKVIELIDEEIFLSDPMKIVFKWILDYYREFKKAPVESIKSIFELESSNIEYEKAELIESFLQKLSDEYERTETFNADYLYNKTVPFLEKKNLKLMIDKANLYLSLNKLDEAKQCLNKQLEFRSKLSNWVNPLDHKFMNHVLHNVDEKFFMMPGKLGEFLGNIKRGQFVGIMGPYKRGKSFILQEIAIQGMLSGLNVVFISLEMSAEDVSLRIYKRITSCTTKDGTFLYPCFDCKHNQTGICRKSYRTGKVSLTTGEEKPAFEDAKGYVVCTYCKDNNIEGYELETWFIEEKRKRITFNKLKRHADSVKLQFGDRIRIMAYPAYQANIKDAMQDLDVLEQDEGFIPDIIVTDYADIFAPEDRRVTGRDLFDLTWKAHKNLASVRSCAVFTGSQSNKASADKKNVSSTDVAEDYRKLAHVDAMWMLNQTEKEKDKGVMRISFLSRHKGYNELKQVTILQNLDLAQPLLDSDYTKKVVDF